MPRGILGSLAICTVLYVAVSLVVTGMVKYDKVKVEAPLAEAFRSVDKPVFATIVSIGALAGLTTVMMILMIGQSRVFFAMARDGLLPPVFASVKPEDRDPRAHHHHDRRCRRCYGRAASAGGAGEPGEHRHPARVVVPDGEPADDDVVRFAVWMVVGMVVYFLYGHGHSRLGRGYAGEREAPRRTG